MRERDDIHAAADAAAIARAQKKFRAHAEQMTLTNFCLYDSAEKFVYKMTRKDPR